MVFAATRRKRVASFGAPTHNSLRLAQQGGIVASHLSISRAWDQTREIMRRDGRLLAAVAAALLIFPGVVRDLFTPVAAPGEMPAPGVWMIIWLLTVVIAIVGQLAFVQIALAPGTTVGDALRHSARRAPAYVAAQLIWVLPLAAVILLLGPRLQPPNPSPAAALLLLACVAALIYLSVRLLLAPAVAVGDSIAPIAILKRSWALGGGRWWRLFAFLLLFVVAAVILIFVIVAVVGSIAKVLVGTVEQFSVTHLLLSLVSQIALAAAYGTLMIMIARLYAQVAGRDAEASVPSTGD